jgi:Tfp pilus assembly protein PilP
MKRRLIIIVFMGLCALLPCHINARDSMNIRDPFQPVIDSSIKKSLSEYPINSIQFMGVIKNDGFNQSNQRSNNKIVIADPQHRVYFLKRGDVICQEHAKIKNILDDEVLLEWIFQNQIFTDRLKLSKEG